MPDPFRGIRSLNVVCGLSSGFNYDAFQRAKGDIINPFSCRNRFENPSDYEFARWRMGVFSEHKDYNSLSDNELCARMAERIGYRFEANDGGTAFRLVDLELDKEPWRSSLEEAWRDAPNFIETLWLWDQPEILIPLGRNAWVYWKCLNQVRGDGIATQRDRVIAFLMSIPERPNGF